MADTDRDALIRLTGQLQAATQMVEMINVPHERKRVRDLVDVAQRSLNKAMLAAWEDADSSART